MKRFLAVLTGTAFCVAAMAPVLADEFKTSADQAAQAKKNVDASKSQPKMKETKTRSQRQQGVESATTQGSVPSGSAAAAQAKKNVDASKSQPKMKETQTKAERAKAVESVTKEQAKP